MKVAVKIVHGIGFELYFEGVHCTWVEEEMAPMVLNGMEVGNEREILNFCGLEF